MSRELYFSIFILSIFIITNIFHISTIINLQSDNLGLKLQLDLLNLLSNKCSYDENSRNPIIFVTPTVFRPEQKADLTRLGQTLSSVCNLIWIVVEDAEFPSEFIDDLINRLKIKGIHLTAQTPKNKKRRDSEPRWKYPRGVVQRNSALLWIKENLNFWKRGIVYFGDDDNTYDWRIFEEMRKIKQKIGVWPVGIVGGMLVETPLLKKTLENYTVIGFNSRWRPERPFPMDMAGFAINISLIHEHPMSYFNYESPRGFMESHFLQSFDIKIEDLEPLAMDCTKVLVWHTRTEKTPLLNNEYQKYFLAINISSRLTTVEEDAIF